METSLTVHFSALCASAVITLALLQSVALLGHPRPDGQSQVAQTQASSLIAPTR